MAAFDPALPLAQAHTIPAAWYTAPAQAERERRMVFGQSWVVAGRADQVAAPGSYLTTTVAGEPLLVLRDTQGTLRAFYNVCRHRAAPLLTEPCGTATRLRCRYHGWTYDLTGQLRGVPEFEGVDNFHRADNGLVPVHVAQWGPLVWVYLGDRPASLSNFLDPLPDRCDGLGMEQLQFVTRRTYELACNWKVFVDNYLDGGYHVNSIHPGLASVLDYSEYRTECFGWTSLQSSPLKGAVDLSSVRGGDRAYYWYVFPNLMVNLYRDVMDTNLVLPLGPERCYVQFDFYFATTLTPAFIEQSVAVAHQIQLEDQTICEEVQRGLHSRSYVTGRFSVKREAAGYHFHQLLARCLAGSDVAPNA